MLLFKLSDRRSPIAVQQLGGIVNDSGDDGGASGTEADGGASGETGPRQPSGKASGTGRELSFAADLASFDRGALRPTATVVSELPFVEDTAPDAELALVAGSLYVGSQDAATNEAGLAAAGITHVVKLITLPR